MTNPVTVEDSTATIRFQYNEDGDLVTIQKSDYIYLLATGQLGCIFAAADVTENSLQKILYESLDRMIQNNNPDHGLYIGFAAGMWM